MYRWALQRMRSRLAGLAIVMIVLAFACGAAIGWNFVVVDRAYQRVTSSEISTRAEFEAKVQPLRGRMVTDASDMAPNLVDVIRPDDEYIRYSWFGSKHGIDVIYDRTGRIRRIWPEYE